MKKYTAIIAAVALIAVTATGCGSSDISSSSKLSVSVTSTEVSTAADTTVPETAFTETETTEENTAATNITEGTSEEPTNENTTKTSEPSEMEFFPASDLPDIGLSVAALEGRWIIGQFIDTIQNCDIYHGEMLMQHEGGSEDCNIRLEYSLGADGSKSYWYNVYANDGTMRCCFPATGELPLDTLTDMLSPYHPTYERVHTEGSED